MAAVVRKTKQDDKYLKALRELVTTGGGNRQCFDCGQKGPTYVNMTIGSFVCTRCSGVLRGLTPPHRVKSISMATFTQEEIDFLKAHGNVECAKTWLGLWDPKRAVHQDHRELMIDKYERKRYYLEPASPLKTLSTAAAATATQMNGTGHGHSNGHFLSYNGKSKQCEQCDTSASATASSTASSSASSYSVISRPSHSGGMNGDSHQQKQRLQDAFSSKQPSGHASNGFSSDDTKLNGFDSSGNFVADFGSANIFDATTNSSVNSPAMSSLSSAASSNGYAKIQPMMMNGHSKAAQVNGVASSPSTSSTATAPSAASMLNGNGNTENFADFDHAPIYNATLGANNKSTNSSTSAKNSSNNNVTNGGTPSEDRYAALKDLDEQLREGKAAAAALDAFGNAANGNGGVNGNPANPFMGQVQQQQQQGQQQQQQMNQNHQLYGQMTVIPANGLIGNSFNGVAASPPGVTATAFLSYPNGFNGNPPANVMYNGVMPNGCGFGFGAMHQQIAVNGGSGGNGFMGDSPFNNPFAATGGGFKSNNPFL